MSTSAVDRGSHRALGSVLREQLARARERARELEQRARQLEAELQGARAAERAAHENLIALEAIAAEAAGLVGEVSIEDHRVEHRLERVDVDERPEVHRLAGAKLREMAVRVALRRGARCNGVHWRQWYGWLREYGFDAAGKKPEATFLTQLARSPLVRRSEKDGVYELGLDAVPAERRNLIELHDRLAALPAPGQTSLLEGLDDIRERRRALQAEVARSERHLREMLHVLAHERPPGWDPRVDETPGHLIAAWLHGLDEPMGDEQLLLD